MLTADTSALSRFRHRIVEYLLRLFWSNKEKKYSKKPGNRGRRTLRKETTCVLRTKTGRPPLYSTILKSLQRQLRKCRIQFDAEEYITATKSVKLDARPVCVMSTNNWPRICYIKTLAKRDVQLEMTKTRKDKLNTNEESKESTKADILASGKVLYCVRVSIGITENSVQNINSLLDIGSQSGLFARSFLTISWIGEEWSEHGFNLCSATNEHIFIMGVFKLYIRSCDIRSQETFIVVETLSVNIPIETNFIEK